MKKPVIYVVYQQTEPDGERAIVNAFVFRASAEPYARELRRLYPDRLYGLVEQEVELPELPRPVGEPVDPDAWCNENCDYDLRDLP
jgi:hypothetical protein